MVRGDSCSRASDQKSAGARLSDDNVFDNICPAVHYLKVAWKVDFHDAFVVEYRAWPKDVQDELLACVLLLEQFGPLLGRPRVDTLNGSRFPNMTELRFEAADGVWRVRTKRKGSRDDDEPRTDQEGTEPHAP